MRVGFPVGRAMAGPRQPRQGLSPLSAGLAACAIFACMRMWPSQEVAFAGGTVAAPSREVKVARYGGDKKMKARIGAVTKTQKVMDAMRMIAASKVRRAQDGIEKARPFSVELQSMIKGIVKKLKGSGLEAEIPMLRVPEKVTNVALLFLGSNRGMCGGYNSLNAKRAVKRIEELNKLGIVPKLIVLGKKAEAKITSRLDAVPGLQYNYTKETMFFDFPDAVTSEKSTEVADKIRNMFLSGEVDKVEVVWSRFINLIKNEPAIKTILPLSPAGIEDAEDMTFTMTTEDGKMTAKKTPSKDKVKGKDIEPDMIFDQSPQTILNSMLPLYLNSQILALFFDAQASELSSRMTAMKAAVDNSKELKRKLMTIYNKKRQAGITQELMEIVTAGLALENEDDVDGGMFDEVMESKDDVYDEFLEDMATDSIAATIIEPWDNEKMMKKIGLEAEEMIDR